MPARAGVRTRRDGNTREVGLVAMGTWRRLVRTGGAWMGRLGMALTLAATGSGLLLPSTTTGAQAAGDATLRVTAPASVRVGEAIELTLTMQNARRVAGYEVHVMYDTTVAEYAGLQQRKKDLSALGFDLQPLDTVETPDGIAFGAISCPVDSCNRPEPGQRKQRAERDDVLVGVLRILPKRAGNLQIAFDSLKAVDQDGDPVKITLANPLVQVAVGSGPNALAGGKPWQTGGTAKGAKGPFDLNQDGQVSYDDLMETVLEWRSVHERGTPCGGRMDATRDVNHDGCIDVGDVQMLAANYDVKRRARTAGDASLMAVGATFTVNSAGDEDDAAPGNGVCLTAVGTCTLRAALTESQRTFGSNTVNFNIPGTGVHTINIGSRLPTFANATGGVTVDGYSQPGSSPNTDQLASNAQIRIEIHGNLGIEAMAFSSGDNVVRGVAIYEVQRAVYMLGGNARNNQLLGNFLGTNAAGTWAAGGTVTAADTVALMGGANNNRIGGNQLADRNVISGGYYRGVMTWDETTDHNVIINNLIGPNPGGSYALPNRSHGVDINAMSSFTMVGGAGPNERNVISGNLEEGVEISHQVNTSNNQIIGNFIGTEPSGTAGPVWARNQGSGIFVEDGSSNNLVANNVVGNSGWTCCEQGGIIVDWFYANGNRITGNLVGVSLNGTPIPNGTVGIRVADGPHNTVIGPSNTIAYNPKGIVITGDNTIYNTITQNSMFGNGTGITLVAPGNAGVQPPSITNATVGQATGNACAGCRVEVFSVANNGAAPQGLHMIGAGQAQGSGGYSFPVDAVPAGSFITATATDVQGNTSQFSPTVQTGGIVSGVRAQDGFSRTVSGGWGNADIGGPYTLTGSASDFSVNGDYGAMVAPTAGRTRGVMLNVNARDIDISFQLSADKLVNNGGFATYVQLRSDGTTEYRARVRADASGKVYLQVARRAADGDVALGGEVLQPGVGFAPGAFLTFRAQAFGANPTTLRLKVWRTGTTEPDAWGYGVTDWEPVLQDAGSVGLLTYVESNVTNAPVQFLVDNLQARDLSPTLPAPELRVAADSFGRVLTEGWGKADLGGNWVPAGPISAGAGGILGDFQTDGNVGKLNVAATDRREVSLTDVSELNVDATFRFQVNKAAQGDTEYMMFMARRSSSGSEYLARVLLPPNGTVYLQGMKNVSTVESTLTPEVQVPGLTAPANTWLRVRVRVFGVNPTTILAKAWRDGEAEPGAWSYGTSDTDPALQFPGGVGLKGYLGGNASNSPVVFSVDDLVVNRYNLLSNGTFEADMGGWSQWQAGLSRLSISHSGDWAARVRYACPTGTTCTDYAIDNWPGDIANPKQGDTYTATVWVRGDTVDGKPVELGIRERGGANPDQVTMSGDVPVSASGWKQIRVSRTIASPGRTFIDVFVIQHGASPGDAILVDDFSVTPALTNASLQGGSFQGIVAAAGDIACAPSDPNFNHGFGIPGACRQQATADLVASISPAAVLPLGDNQYETGLLEDFQQAFALSWGRFGDLLRPVPGNHEYLSAGGAGYYAYFGARAGDAGRGYYSYDIGTWHVVALNSNCDDVGCAAGSPQEQWLRADLAAHPARCTLAYMHHPRFSSGEHGNLDPLQPLWQALYDAHAEVVLAGHDHDYERFALQRPDGAADPGRGLRSFVVGTGGRHHRDFTSVAANSEVRNTGAFGVLALTLRNGGYDWRFVPEVGASFTDAGSEACR